MEILWHHLEDPMINKQKNGYSSWLNHDRLETTGLAIGKKTFKEQICFDLNGVKILGVTSSSSVLQ